MADKVWSRSRKLMGNLVPTMLCLPFLIVGLLLFRPSRPTDGPAIWFFVAFPIVGWLAVNAFGYYQNGFMRRELTRRLGLMGTGPAERYFVGVARPKYRSSLDPHEDVGFLTLYADRMEFLGETVQVAIERANLKRIRFRGNPHSLFFLGRWISIEGDVAGTPIRLLVEPREKSTLVGNLFFSEGLKSRLEAWLKPPDPPA